MYCDGTPVKAPPASRRKIMPPTPQQSPQPSIEAMQLKMEVEDQEFVCKGEYWWTACDRVVIARMEQYLDRSESMKLEIEELELVIGPEDSEVAFGHFLMYARKKKGRKIFETFSSKGPSEFLVVSRARWDEYQRMLVTWEEESRRRAQEVECFQSIARRMLSCLDLSEALKVSTTELKEQVLSPNEPSVNMERRQGAQEGNAWTLAKQLSI